MFYMWIYVSYPAAMHQRMKLSDIQCTARLWEVIKRRRINVWIQKDRYMIGNTTFTVNLHRINGELILCFIPLNNVVTEQSEWLQLWDRCYFIISKWYRLPQEPMRTPGSEILNIQVICQMTAGTTGWFHACARWWLLLLIVLIFGNRLNISFDNDI